MLLGDALGLHLQARGGYRTGAGGSAALPIRMKGELGEGLSKIKTLLKGDRPVRPQVRTTLDNGKLTVVDHVTGKGSQNDADYPGGN